MSALGFATPDWLWLVVGAWLGSLVLFVVILFLNWPEDRHDDEVGWDEFVSDDDE